jgi:hypothetical protein
MNAWKASKHRCLEASMPIIDAYRCLEASMPGSIDDWKIARIYFLTLASILFRAIRVTEIGGKSILGGKSTIFSDLVDLPVLPDHRLLGGKKETRKITPEISRGGFRECPPQNAHHKTPTRNLGCLRSLSPKTHEISLGLQSSALQKTKHHKKRW